MEYQMSKRKAFQRLGYGLGKTISFRPGDDSFMIECGGRSYLCKSFRCADELEGKIEHGQMVLETEMPVSFDEVRE
jgi:hypothetical protein